MCAPEYTSTIVAESPHGVLHQGDCLEIMPTFAPQSVDMVLCDLPYGTTQCKWDTVIPFEPLWREYKRLIKPRGAIVLTASQPFTSALIMSNVKMFKYCWYWKKERGTGFAQSGKRPLMIVEDIAVFYEAQPVYYPHKRPLANPYSHILPASKGAFEGGAKMTKSAIGGKRIVKHYTHETPHQLLEFTRDRIGKSVGKLHPTQKPVALFEYLVKTYTQPGAVVLDNCAGSGTTGAACINTGRKFLLIEREQKYVDIIEKRVFSPAATLFSLELDKTTV